MKVKLADLPASWRALAARVNDGGSPTLLVDCAEELELALEEHAREPLPLERVAVSLMAKIAGMCAETHRTCNCAERLRESVRACS